VSRKTPFLLTTILVFLLACTSSEGSTGNIVKPCQIEVPHNLQDASFTLAYSFETTKQGKLIHIRKVRNDFLPDAPFHTCVAQWKLPSVSGHGLAEFTRTPTEGWKEIHISGKGFDHTFLYH